MNSNFSPTKTYVEPRGKLFLQKAFQDTVLGENSTVWGDPFYGLSAQIELLCLFSSKQTFLNLGCSGSVR